MRELIDDPATWPGDDLPPRRRTSSSVAAASLGRSIQRLSESHAAVLAHLEANTPVPDEVLFIALGRTIEAMQIMHQVALDEAAGATTDAVRDIHVMRRQTEAAMRESFAHSARAGGAADRADGAALVALEAAQRALLVEDRSAVRAESAARLVVRQETTVAIDEARRLALWGLGVGAVGVVVGVVGVVLALLR